MTANYNKERKLENLTYNEIKSLHDLIEANIKSVCVMCSNASINRNIASADAKLAKYLNDECTSEA